MHNRALTDPPPHPPQVVLDHMEDLDRAHEYATKVDEAPVWSELANAYLEHAQVGRGWRGRKGRQGSVSATATAAWAAGGLRRCCAAAQCPAPPLPASTGFGRHCRVPACR